MEARARIALQATGRIPSRCNFFSTTSKIRPCIASPGHGGFTTGSDDGVPPVLLHHLKHNKVLHQRVLLVSVKTADVPETSAAERVRVLPLGRGSFWRVIASYGFMQSPNVPQVLEVVDQMGIRCKPMETSYFLGRERLISTATRPGEVFSMARWRKILFSILARNARRRRSSLRFRPIALSNWAPRSSSNPRGTIQLLWDQTRRRSIERRRVLLTHERSSFEHRRRAESRQRTIGSRVRADLLPACNERSPRC